MAAQLNCVVAMSTVPQIVSEAEGNRLRSAFQRYRITKRITQAEVALACGWQSASTFNRVLKGKVPLTLVALMKIAEVLEVDPYTISPRLAPRHVDGTEGRQPRALSVSSVVSVTRGSWSEPFLSTKTLTYFTSDEGAFALVFEPGQAPEGIDGWVMVVEPARRVVEGDRVIVQHGVGKYSLGQVTSLSTGTSVSVSIPELGDLLAPAKRCMLVASLCRPSELV